jgi:hypothetical protein
MDLFFDLIIICNTFIGAGTQDEEILSIDPETEPITKCKSSNQRSSSSQRKKISGESFSAMNIIMTELRSKIYFILS